MVVQKVSVVTLFPRSGNVFRQISLIAFLQNVMVVLGYRYEITSRTLALPLAGCFGFGGGGKRYHEVKVMTMPDNCDVYVDGTQLGNGVTVVPIEDETRAYQLKVCGPPGYFCNSMTIGATTPRSIEVSVPKDHSYYDTVSANDIVNRWLQVQVSDNYSAAEAWQKLVASISTGIADFEVMDQKSFYLKTAWKIAGKRRDSLRTRSRIVVSAESIDKGNVVFKIKIEAERINRDKEKVKDIDRTFKAFIDAVETAQSRLKISSK